MITAYIQYNCVPHYRKKIFEALAACPGIRFTICADEVTDTPFMKVLSGEELKDIRFKRVKTHYFRLFKSPLLAFQPAFIRMMKEDRPDVVIVLGGIYSITAWVAAIRGRMLNIPVLSWTHGYLKPEGGAKRFFRDIFYKIFTGHLLYGEHAKKIMIEYGYPADSLHVIYNSLDTEAQLSVSKHIGKEDIVAWKRSFGLSEADRVIVFTGRLQPVKQLDLVIVALSRLFQKGKKAHVFFVGHGVYREALIRLAKDLQVNEHVHFLGECHDEHKLALVLSAGDLCVIPSGAGLSIMHAMIYGTPTLISDNPGMNFPEWEAVQEGVTGFFYRHGDLEDLTAKIDQALYPVAQKERMASSCKDIILKKYSPDRQVEFFSDAIRATLGRRRLEI